MADTNTVHVGTAAAAPSANYDVRLVTVENDVRGLKTDLGEIKSTVSTGFKELGAAMAAKGQTNWAALSLIGMLVVAIAGWGWGLFGRDQTRLENQITELKARADRYMTREDIVAQNTAGKEIAELKAQISAGKVERLAVEVADIQTKVVPLSTHKQLWENQRDTNKALADLVEENRKAIAGIAAPRDTITRIYKRLDDIDEHARRDAAR